MAAMTFKHRINQLRAKFISTRTAVQTLFLFAWLDPLLLRMHHICGTVFHCHSCPLALFACPVGIVANFSALQIFPFMAVGTVLLVGTVFGSLICGWVCPFGFLQDLAGRLSRYKLHLPGWTSHFRYAVLLGAVIFIPYFFGSSHPLFICSFCPVGTLEGAVPSMARQYFTGQTVTWPNVLKITVTVLFLMAIFLYRRPWCRILCPLGAVFGLLNKAGLLVLGIEPSKCTSCKRCKKLCQYGLDPQHQLDSSRCIRCFECAKCPKDALTHNLPFKTGKNEPHLTKA